MPGGRHHLVCLTGMYLQTLLTLQTSEVFPSGMEKGLYSTTVMAANALHRLLVMSIIGGRSLSVNRLRSIISC